ncbi:uncharacterized protein B4U80_12130, partial [Leptotrombidium deliense]
MMSLIRTGQPLIICTPIPIMEWVKMPGEQLAGTPIEQRALKWKWYLEGLLIDRTESSTSEIMELVTDQPLVPSPKKPAEEKLIPLAKWGPPFRNQKTAWFTEGSSKIKGDKLHWKAAAWNPVRRETLVKEGTDKSAQYAELFAVKMAIDYEVEKGNKTVYIYTDSWAVANGLAIWSGRWRINNWKINNSKVWSEETWKDIAKIVDSGFRIYVTHVDAHTRGETEERKHNIVADKLASAQTRPIYLQRQWKINKEETGNKLRLKKEWQKVDKDPIRLKLQINKEVAQVSEEEILDIHRNLGHIGRHALMQWFIKRNIKVPITSISKAVGNCQQCPQHEIRFKAYGNPDSVYWDPRTTLQMDFIGPLDNIGFRGWYACTLVELSSGLGYARQ